MLFYAEKYCFVTVMELQDTGTGDWCKESDILMSQESADRSKQDEAEGSW